jgi:hypothetical protein
LPAHPAAYAQVGARLITLHDDAEVLVRCFGNVIHEAPIACAIDLTIPASRSHRSDHAGVATTAIGWM